LNNNIAKAEIINQKRRKRKKKIIMLSNLKLPLDQAGFGEKDF